MEGRQGKILGRHYKEPGGDGPKMIGDIFLFFCLGQFKSEYSIFLSAVSRVLGVCESHFQKSIHLVIPATREELMDLAVNPFIRIQDLSPVSLRTSLITLFEEMFLFYRLRSLTTTGLDGKRFLLFIFLYEGT